jgi:hypothetical protein
VSEEAEGRDKDLKFVDRRRRRENEGIDSGLISRSGNFLRACCRGNSRDVGTCRRSKILD